MSEERIPYLADKITSLAKECELAAIKLSSISAQLPPSYTFGGVHYTSERRIDLAAQEALETARLARLKRALNAAIEAYASEPMP